MGWQSRRGRGIHRVEGDGNGRVPAGRRDGDGSKLGMMADDKVEECGKAMWGERLNG